MGLCEYIIDFSSPLLPPCNWLDTGSKMIEIIPYIFITFCYRKANIQSNLYFMIKY